MRKGILWVLLGMLLMLQFSCKNAKDINIDKLGEIEIYMKKTACFGTCPVFEIRINEEGIAILQGERFMTNIGLFEKKISDEQLLELVMKLEESNFFELEEKYMEKVADIPTTVISYQRKKMSKRIMFNMNYPDLLREIETLLKDIALEETGWTEVNE